MGITYVVAHMNNIFVVPYSVIEIKFKGKFKDTTIINYNNGTSLWACWNLGQ